MPMPNNYPVRERVGGVFIITYKRPDPKQQKTLKLLESMGYSGRLKLVLSNDDPTVDKYIENYGRDRVYVFDRESVDCDYFDNEYPYTGCCAVRNAAWDIAADLGWTHFLVLDDDYTALMWNMPLLVPKKIWTGPRKWTALGVWEKVNDLMWDALDAIPRLICVGMAQGGDNQGRGVKKPCKRKVMQTFYLRTDRRFPFMARLNDDVTGYFNVNLQGRFFTLQHALTVVMQPQTQSRPGGVTEEYRRLGTYRKSMYTMLRWPGHVRVKYQPTLGRIHHFIVPFAYPQILESAYGTSTERN